MWLAARTRRSLLIASRRRWVYSEYRMSDNGEGPPDKDAKEKAKKVLDDPAHRKPKGSPEDERTRDDPQKENET